MEKWDKEENSDSRVYEPKQIISITMERDETGKLHAHADCAIDYLFEQESVEDYLATVLQMVKDGKGKGDQGTVDRRGSHD